MWRNKSLGVVLVLAMASALAQAEQPNSCVDCHSALEGELRVTQEQFAQDIHAQKGLTCASCHGGDPSKTDDSAMSKVAGFKGKVDRAAVPKLCGSCHSDPGFMRQYNPSLRTDQLSQYQTSVHGKRQAAGDTKVAVCTDCHGVHDLRPATDTRSKVHPLNIAATCSRCHADSKYMAAYKIPTDQYAAYKTSVHHQAMVERGDLSAPTCTTCHGNHGATPPGVASVANVCSTCHVFQAQLFDSSPHKAAFASAGLPGCVTCHSNHGISQPSDAMLGTSAKSVCTNCHTQGDAGYQAAGDMQQQIHGLETSITRSDAILSRAESSGMEVSQARLELDQARDALTKARVSVHTFAGKPVRTDVDSGLKITAKTYSEGQAALRERDYRRTGLGMALVAIVFVMVALRLYIKEIEKNGKSGS
ncbi:MAG TPA: cytochrome c3 family protein [Terriglobales bacterium]|jgi:predicted CXXCH cytochrome family protein|nr:cytochrome c3 family protein [Terriglobales bacterium]